MSTDSTHSEKMSHAPWGQQRPSAFVRFWLGLIYGLPATSFFRRLAIWLRKPIKQYLKGWVDVQIWGLNLRLRSNGNLSEQRLIHMPQYLDTTERNELAKALDQGGVFFDIGANAGIYSLWIASLRNPRTRIEAFEPDPNLCESLKFNLQTNSIESVSVNCLAVGSKEGSVNLLAGVGNKGENRIVEDAAEDALIVDMTTLPSFIQRSGIEKIDALKIDIEGNEIDALKPMFEKCPESVWPRIVVCELAHDSDDELNKLLESHGYSLYAKGRLNGIYRKA